MPGPLIAITPDLVTLPSGRVAAQCALPYIDAVQAAGGHPIVLAPVPELAAEHARSFDGFVFTGGNDPVMEEFGQPTHPAATPVHLRRQRYELALLQALREQSPDRPTLGICLGMQFMSLHAGGTLDQHLPDILATHARHRDATHSVVPAGDASRRWLRVLAGGGSSGRLVQSNHHQAVRDPGTLQVVARSEDGVIEAVGDPGRAFYLGVQWHPERTEDPALGIEVFRSLVGAVRRGTQ